METDIRASHLSSFMSKRFVDGVMGTERIMNQPLAPLDLGQLGRDQKYVPLPNLRRYGL